LQLGFNKRTDFTASGPFLSSGNPVIFFAAVETAQTDFDSALARAPLPRHFRAAGGFCRVRLRLGLRLRVRLEFPVSPCGHCGVRVI